MKKTAKTSAIACVSAVSLLAMTACSGAGKDPMPTTGGIGGMTPSSGPATVSLSVMTSDRFLELAKQRFEETHPDIRIDIKEYMAAPSTGAQQPGQNMMVMTRPDPKNIEKYVSTVGAELMSGKASDIIVMNDLPYKKYADKKLLENIGDLMSKDAAFKLDQYYTGIFDAMKYGGALYTVPVKVGLNMWLGNEAVLSGAGIDDKKWTWEEFKQLAGSWAADNNKDGKPDTYPLGKIAPAQLITLMLNSSIAKFADMGGKQAKFDSPAFIQLLKLAKSMYDEQFIVPDNGDANNIVIQPQANIISFMDMYSMPKSVFDGKGAYYDLPSENDARGTLFTTSMPLAINSKSANKQAAWEFVKFLLSDEMQSARELNGFPVNKNGSKAQGESWKNIGGGNGKGGGAKIKMKMNGKELNVQPATDEDLAMIEKALSNAKVYAESDPKITSIVVEESAPFFQGQKSAEEAAKVIQNKVSTYLQE
ncbi:multiple sugar transport system substrate-binding protein [Paenibacillus sp. UNCCL117]|uniref:ABC transporter substrate-binding protein n=1 Tax=unclassified Paenibacillus TaxID=185978 RepID=UPI0008850014|nr:MULTISPECIES: extracellular solute-binding protein [unclassified Paenibacillus]SDD55880.1 carbohydrate ABC transporter substrate-binding protein, CUT1 family [Paenibacillus sp. cl123]SFW51496.1 multiple sugar transport system substrate-binding protein [Paenibacillus sp. UNCCL117]